MKSLTTRQKQAIDTKLKIIKVATGLFKEKSLHKVTIREICMKAEISVGTFYHHFESKEEIITIAYKQIDLLWEEQIATFVCEDIESCIINFFEAAGDLVEKQGWELASFSYQQLLANKGENYSFNHERPIFKYLLTCIKQGQKDHILQNTINCHVLAETLIRFSRGTIFDWCLAEGSYSLKEQLKKDISRILRTFFS